MSERNDSQSKNILDEVTDRRGALSLVALGAVLGWATVRRINSEKEDTTPVGIDISYPQGESGQELPDNPTFIIVGVNGGLATTPNPYLASQLRQAVDMQESESRPEVVSQPPIQLYVNTGNPGEVIDQVDTWPRSGVDLAGEHVYNPYGVCDGTNSEACSWMYGRNRVIDTVFNMFDPAAEEAGVERDPAAYVWWLDVETENTWQSGSDEALGRNVATLEGMVACFEELNCKVGLYSTEYQWGEIVGKMVREDSNLNGRDSWLAGASNKKNAREMCEEQPLTSGGRVVLTQYIQDNLDHNYPCVVAGS